MNLCELLEVDFFVINLKVKIYEKVDSLGENWSVVVYIVVFFMCK